MQTSYQVNQDIALEGMPVGERESRPGFLPYLSQQTQIRIALSEAGDLGITVVDDETQQSWSLTTALSGAVEATSLNEMLAAWRADGPLNNIASVTEDGVDDFVITFRVANKTYTVTATPPGSMTAVVSELQAPGGAGLEFGRMVARGVGDMEIVQVDGATVVGDLYGMLFRTDANHFRSYENDGPSALDLSRRGMHYSLMTRGRVMVKVEQAVTPGSAVFMRKAATGRLGGFRADADGGDAIDISSIAEFETTAPVDGFARLRVKM